MAKPLMKDASYLSHSPAAKQWQHVQIRHHHGIVVPFVSSRAAHFVSSGVLCFPFVSRLASLARSRLGPAQYHR